MLGISPSVLAATCSLCLFRYFFFLEPDHVVANTDLEISAWGGTGGSRALGLAVWCSPNTSWARGGSSGSYPRFSPINSPHFQKPLNQHEMRSLRSFLLFFLRFFTHAGRGGFVSDWKRCGETLASPTWLSHPRPRAPSTHFGTTAAGQRLALRVLLNSLLPVNIISSSSTAEAHYVDKHGTVWLLEQDVRCRSS